MGQVRIRVPEWALTRVTWRRGGIAYEWVPIEWKWWVTIPCTASWCLDISYLGSLFPGEGSSREHKELVKWGGNSMSHDAVWLGWDSAKRETRKKIGCSWPGCVTWPYARKATGQVWKVGGGNNILESLNSCMMAVISTVIIPQDIPRHEVPILMFLFSFSSMLIISAPSGSFFSWGESSFGPFPLSMLSGRAPLLFLIVLHLDGFLWIAIP